MFAGHPRLEVSTRASTVFRFVFGCMFSCLCASIAQATIEVTGAPNPSVANPTKAQPHPAPKRPVAAKDANPAAPTAPSLSVGDTWEFTRTADLKSNVIGSIYRATISTVAPSGYGMDNGQRMTRGLALLNVFEDGKITQNIRPGAFSVRFPLTIGKRWSESWELVKSDGTVSARVTAEGRVAAIEKITVPAGTFETYRVVHTWRTKLGDGSIVAGTRAIWYAPAAKYFVRYAYERTQQNGTVLTRYVNELKSYSVARQ